MSYQRKMEALIAQCPGFIGADMPEAPQRLGRVIIDPARIVEAHAWLRRRFEVSEELELSRELDGGLCVNVMSKPPRTVGVKWRKHSGFVKPIQYELPLQ